MRRSDTLTIPLGVVLSVPATVACLGKRPLRLQEAQKCPLCGGEVLVVPVKHGQRPLAAPSLDLKGLQEAGNGIGRYPEPGYCPEPKTRGHGRFDGFVAAQLHHHPHGDTMRGQAGFGGVAGG